MDLPAPYLKTPFVDWLSFSIEYGPKSFSWIESVFGKGESLEKGFNGYTHSILTPIGAVVGYSPETPSQKIHLSISSKALFNLNGFITLKELIRQVISNKGKFSRIDLSQDDYDGFLNLDLILEKLKNMEVTSRFRGFLKMEQHNPGFLEYELGSLFRDPKKQKTGRTIYIGDWHSDNFCRIYDKKKQTNSDYKFWNRVEFQLRHKVANEFCNPSFRLNTKTGEIKSFDGTFEDRSFPKTAYYYLKFLAPSYKMINDKKEETLYLVEKHKRHWDHCEWWTDFLRTGEGQNIGLPKNETGLEDLKDWQLNQCSGADYLLMKTYGQKYSHEKLLEGKKKFENNKRYQILFKEYQSKSNTVKEEDFS